MFTLKQVIYKQEFKEPSQPELPFEEVRLPWEPKEGMEARWNVLYACVTAVHIRMFTQTQPTVNSLCKLFSKNTSPVSALGMFAVRSYYSSAVVVKSALLFFKWMYWWYSYKFCKKGPKMCFKWIPRHLATVSVQWHWSWLLVCLLFIWNYVWIILV